MKNIILFLSLLISLGAAAQKNEGFAFTDRPEKKQIDLTYNGKLLTAYCYYDSIFKPFLYPLVTVDGIAVTRGWPIAPRAGERIDHPHHTGMWLNYESV